MIGGVAAPMGELPLMKANNRLNSVAERFDTITSVIFNCNNQNTARCKANINLIILTA